MTASLKSPIRKEKIDARLRLHTNEWQAFSAQVRENLIPLLKASHQPVALYYPIRGEVDVLPLMQQKEICLPVIQSVSRELSFRRCATGQHLEKNALGIMQPAEDAPLCNPAIIVVPAVAFDRRGFRIGYGGGYYDTTLALLHKKSKITAIGVAFSFQEIPEVPTEPFDKKLDMIVTDQEVLTFS